MTKIIRVDNETIAILDKLKEESNKSYSKIIMTLYEKSILSNDNSILPEEKKSILPEKSILSEDKKSIPSILPKQEYTHISNQEINILDNLISKNKPK